MTVSQRLQGVNTIIIIITYGFRGIGMDTTETKRPEPRQVRILNKSYQPSKAELEEDLRVDATFDEAVEALCRPVKIRSIHRPK